jgi:hypothetical protein
LTCPLSSSVFFSRERDDQPLYPAAALIKLWNDFIDGSLDRFSLDGFMAFMV